MAEKRHPRGNRRGAARTARGQLRRFHDIENVMIEEPFALYKPAAAAGGGSEEDRKAGDGCYVSATVQNRRYYGLLVDQEVLKDASLLWFEDEAGSLDLNRRMKMLCDNVSEEATKNWDGGTSAETGSASGNKKRPPSEVAIDMEAETKRLKLEDGTTAVVPEQVASVAHEPVTGRDAQQPPVAQGHHRHVQKFRYVRPTDRNNPKDLGYRYLLATYADIEAASEGDAEKAKKIDEACQVGGGFVGKFYYQYEVLRSSLQTAVTITEKESDDSMRTSMGFDSFLHGTQLPQWFPLSNLHIGQHKVLSLLNMKKDNNGNAIWNIDAETGASKSSFQGTHVPMEARNVYRIGIMGGGISGLACALELLRLCKNESIDAQVILMEGRSRLGGRLLTDRQTFKSSDGSQSFPVDLGAGWIHGIDHNPLASLAREAGVTFVTASEEVKMLHSRQREVDKEVDERMGKLFDDLLDLGADDCWGANDAFDEASRNQLAVRWYSANLSGGSSPETGVDDGPSSSYGERPNGPEAATSEALGLARTDAPPHRHSSDVSIDCATGKAIAKHKFREFSKLSRDEHLMLQWNMKNVEYALGANISDLSTKFWDSDERHAFEGDHVLLKEGYSTLVDYIVEQLREYGEDKFQCLTDFPIGKVAYARRSTTQKYPDASGRKLVELSDACSVTSEDGTRTFKCDFLVCTLPLGVLKQSLVQVEGHNHETAASEKKIVFDPPLPLSKRDAINIVGFGLLDKIYLQFAFPFWREPLGLDGDKYLFGNSSGVHSHYYMFTDVGLTLGGKNDAPPILMSLISGKEAVNCELLAEEQMVKEALEVLQELLAPLEVPQPIAVKRTKWGIDRFSRGCYTFLPPGATDQDFQILQSPVNGNGDSLVLEGSETMRLFFAGEHTTALHPSMAHGAMLSGIRAAKEIVSTMNFNFNTDKTGDRLIPVALFRKDNPDMLLQCSMCQEMGSRVREGSLLAFKRGARQALVHNNCAEYSPEVEVYEGQWRNVIKAVNRGRGLHCALCSKSGATIGCTHKDCYRVYHFNCSEDTGWRFDRDGKVFFCDLHRKHSRGDSADRVGLAYYVSKTPHAVIRCFLCGGEDHDTKAGDLLAFQRGNKRILVHEKCARYTTVVDTKEDTESRAGIEFGNIFEAIEKARTCAQCGQHGATTACASCDLTYHFPCALETGWRAGKRNATFRCKYHRADHGKVQGPGGTFQHALFSVPSVGASSHLTAPANSASEASLLTKTGSHEEVYISDSSDSEASSAGGKAAFNPRKQELPVACKPPGPEDTTLEPATIQLQRRSLRDSWKISVVAVKDALVGKHILSVDTRKYDRSSGDFKHGQRIQAINGIAIGSEALDTFQKVLSLLGKETDVMIEVLRDKTKNWDVHREPSPEPEPVYAERAVRSETRQNSLSRSQPRRMNDRSEKDPIFSLSATTQRFLSSLGISTGKQFLENRTGDLANSFVEWRAMNDMSVLKGTGAIASVSAWKTHVRNVFRNRGLEELALTEPDNKNIVRSSSFLHSPSEPHTLDTDITVTAASARPVEGNSEPGLEAFGGTSSIAGNSDGSEPELAC